MQERLTADEERELIQNVATQPENFRRLYQHYFSRIYAYVAARVGNQQDAEDIVSDVFMSVVEAIGQFEYRHHGSFAAWIFRIAHNAVQEFYRHSNRRNTMSLTVLSDQQSNIATPDELLMQKEKHERVQAMLASLSPRRQEIISLRYFGELRNQEIAEVLGLNEKTIASHLARGLQDLQRKYGQKDTQHEG